MWTCLDCGRSFANTDQWHACQQTTLDEALADQSELAVSIYERVVDELQRMGEFRVHPQQTRIAFISRMTFGGVSLARKWVDLSLVLSQPIDDARVRRLELYAPTSWNHIIRLYRPGDVDTDVKAWLADALRRGDQETLDPDAEVRPLTGRQLDVFWTGFRARVETRDDEQIVRLPGHVTEALALVDGVSLRIGGHRYSEEIRRGNGAAWIAVDPSTGLGEGDETDIFMEVDD